MAGGHESTSGTENVQRNMAGAQALSPQHPQRQLEREVICRAVRLKYSHSRNGNGYFEAGDCPCILKGLPERPWHKPILQIHDELTFIIPAERLKETVAFIRGCMEEQPFPEFDLPLIAEASAGETFGTIEELD